MYSDVFAIHVSYVFLYVIITERKPPCDMSYLHFSHFANVCIVLVYMIINYTFQMSEHIYMHVHNERVMTLWSMLTEDNVNHQVDELGKSAKL